ncbi:MAG: pimeloyl-ACP methyl ester esterase BioH [Pseudomonadota bacterium]
MSTALVHGWGMHSGLWGDWIERLPEPVALDLPGHGQRPRGEALASLGDVADDFVTAVGEPAVWIGWSLGGLVALRAALDYPKDVLGLVLISSSPCFVRRDDWPYGMDASVFDEFAEGLETDFDRTLNRFTALEVHGSTTARQDLATIRRRVDRYEPPARNTLRDGLALLKGSDLRPELDQLEMPTLIIGGSRDRLASPRALMATGELLSGPPVEIIPGAGHAPFLEHADEVLRHVEQLIDLVRDA